MKYQLDSDKYVIVKAMVRMCEYAVTKYDIVDFFNKLLDSEYFQKFDMDFTIFSQGASYMCHKLEEELEENGIVIKSISIEDESKVLYYKDVAYYLGYLFLNWRIVDNLPRGYLLKYDIEKLVFGYDVLHTQSIGYAIDMIKENYRFNLYK